jgi:hypothetical protein
MSQRDLGFARRAEEDWLIYQGLSTRRNLNQALKLGRAIAKGEELAGSTLNPPTHVALVSVKAADGHGYARTFNTTGHFTIWGDPRVWCYRIVKLWTIQGVEV